MPLTTHRPSAVEEVIHGVVVYDPFRWLEDRTLPETEEWIEEQQRRCDNYFAECGDLMTIRNRVRDYLDIKAVDQPARIGHRYFYRRRDRGKEQTCIYVRDSLTWEERLLVDLSDEGRYASPGIHHISNDGSLLAYDVRFGGEDKKAIRFVDVDSGRMLPDRIDTGYARGLAFTLNQDGVFYCHEMSGDTSEHQILFHLFHGSVADQVVFRVARTRESRLVLTADSVHLGAIWTHQHGTDRVVDFFVAEQNEPLVWKQVLTRKAFPYCPILRHGRIFAVSQEEAPNGKLVELNDDGCEVGTIIPEQGSMIRQLVTTGNRLFASYLHHLVPSVHCWDFSGNDHGSVEVPIDGTIQLLPNLGGAEGVLFYSYESFTQPLAIFEYPKGVRSSQLWHQPTLPARYRRYDVDRVQFPSKDGTPIPMTLVAKQRKHGGVGVPVVMTGYGGFGIAMTPQFSALVSIMVELGATFAIPQIRGGGEFGEAWHDAARGRKRQTAFNDFIAAAEWLSKEKVTTEQQLAIFGGSNSGLLVAAAMTQRPSLFRAVLCIAPLLDMVRYEHFDRAAKWRSEYGTVAEKADFEALHAYSPYHRIEDGVDYPAVLFVTGDKDDRCNPAHVRKAAARLQEHSGPAHPVLVDYSSERGHTPVLPLSERTEALVRRVAFLCRELRVCIPTAGGCDEMPGS